MLVVIGEIRKRISLRRWPDGHLQSMKSELPRLGHEPIQPQPSRRSLRFLQGKRPFKPFTYTRYIGNCVVFKVREEANSPHGCPRTETRWPPAVKPVSQNSTACGDNSQANCHSLTSELLPREKTCFLPMEWRQPFHRFGRHI